MKNYKLIDLLEAAGKQTPPELKNEAAVNYTVNKDLVASNLEAIYHRSSSRLAQLSYFLDSITSITDKDDFRPNLKHNDHIKISFYDYEDMNSKDILLLNKQMEAWMSNQVMRELLEFLHYYLLDVYERCLIIKHSSFPVKITQIENIRKDVDDFEKSDIKKRFKKLRRESKIEISHRNAVASLYNARNVFAHFDGVVQEKFCGNNDYMEVLWPQNSYLLKRRKNNKNIPWHKVPKPFSGDEYSQVIINWLEKPKIQKYMVGDKIKLSVQDIHEMIFFFICIFNEIQQGIIRFANKHDIPARDLNYYGLEQSIVMIGDEILPIVKNS